MFEQQIAKGMSVLGADQIHSVNPDSLNMASMGACMLGTLYPSYTQGLIELGLTEDQAVDHGFKVTDDMDKTFREIMISYVVLTYEWRQALRVAQRKGDNDGQ